MKSGESAGVEAGGKLRRQDVAYLPDPFVLRADRSYLQVRPKIRGKYSEGVLFYKNKIRGILHVTQTRVDMIK